MSNALVWFRQDLRIFDNPALANAYNNHDNILLMYILDETIPLGGAQRWWLHHSLTALNNDLKELKMDLCLRKGKALNTLKQIVEEYQIDTIYWNRCYEPAAIKRDTIIKKYFQANKIKVISTNGSLLHEPMELKTTTGGFFKIFTPFWRACLKQIIIPKPHILASNAKKLKANSEPLASWKLIPNNPNWAVEFENYWQPGEKGANIKLADFINNNIKGYSTSRDHPAKNTTSKLSPHLHFGEISPWQIWRSIEAVKLDKSYDLKSIERFLAEIGWREFSYHLLFHTPSLPNKNFKSKFDTFSWEDNAIFLKNWQQGKTGYPIVDAGMRELWRTGYMHNRVRMIVASFLTKHLLIDWRFGASWFLDTLVDADLASNSASWQWVAGCGSDAAPYFRIFNPILQGEKFDPNGDYIKKWIPELKNTPIKWIHKPWMDPQNKSDFCSDSDYPKPIVDHAEARKAALLNYKLI